MTVRFGINVWAYGSPGLRAAWDRAGIESSKINEIACNAEGSAHLLQFDSVHGRWDKT